MKLALHHNALLVLAFAILAMLSPDRLFAQETDMAPRRYTVPTTGINTEEHDNEATHQPEEMGATEMPSVTYVLKDSLPSRPSSNPSRAQRARGSMESQKTAGKRKEEKDDGDSILSFNFIYYIFQKYKLSDIVDK